MGKRRPARFKREGQFRYWNNGLNPDAAYLNGQTGLAIERWYGLHGAFAERRELFRRRGAGSYYDRHRLAKGDDIVGAGPQWRCTADDADAFVRDLLDDQASGLAYGERVELSEQLLGEAVAL